MSLNISKSDEHPEETSLSVQNQFECVKCHQKSADEPQFYCLCNHHPVCAKCRELSMYCPICELPLVKNLEAEFRKQNQAFFAAARSGSGSKVDEENEDSSDGLKEGDGDKNSKKRKRNDSEAENSQDDFIESDEKKEMVIRVKAGQTIRIINDADNSSVSVTKKPGAEFSITSTSTSGNVTSQVSQVGPNNVNSPVSNLRTIQVGSPIVGNSSPATFQTQTATTATVLPMGNMGIVNGGLGPGAHVRVNNSTFSANGAIINGHNNTIHGTDNVIHGSNNRVFGDSNEVNGINNKIYGNGNVSNKFGFYNTLPGFGCTPQ